jgi:hypothetical protein
MWFKLFILVRLPISVMSLECFRLLQGARTVHGTGERKAGLVTRIRANWNYQRSTATAGPIHSPYFIGLNQQVENLLRCQAFMPVGVDGRVADAECFADIGFFFSGARRQLYGVHVGRHRNVEAAFAAADE